MGLCAFSSVGAEQRGRSGTTAVLPGAREQTFPFPVEIPVVASGSSRCHFGAAGALGIGGFRTGRPANELDH